MLQLSFCKLVNQDCKDLKIECISLIINICRVYEQVFIHDVLQYICRVYYEIKCWREKGINTAIVVVSYFASLDHLQLLKNVSPYLVILVALMFVCSFCLRRWERGELYENGVSTKKCLRRWSVVTGRGGRDMTSSKFWISVQFDVKLTVV